MTMPKDFKKVGVTLPASVTAIVKAAGGEDNFPFAMASIIGALPHIAIAMFEALPRDEYLQFAAGVTRNIEITKEIVNSADPVSAFDAVVAKAKRVN